MLNAEQDKQQLEVAVSKIRQQTAVLQSLAADEAGTYGVKGELAQRLAHIAPCIETQVVAAAEGDFRHSSRPLVTRSQHDMCTGAKHVFSEPITELDPIKVRKKQRAKKDLEEKINAAEHSYFQNVENQHVGGLHCPSCRLFIAVGNCMEDDMQAKHSGISWSEAASSMLMVQKGSSAVEPLHYDEEPGWQNHGEVTVPVCRVFDADLQDDFSGDDAIYDEAGLGSLEEMSGETKPDRFDDINIIEINVNEIDRYLKDDGEKPEAEPPTFKGFIPGNQFHLCHSCEKETLSFQLTHTLGLGTTWWQLVRYGQLCTNEASKGRVELPTLPVNGTASSQDGGKAARQSECQQGRVDEPALPVLGTASSHDEGKAALYTLDGQRCGNEDCFAWYANKGRVETPALPIHGTASPLDGGKAAVHSHKHELKARKKKWWWSILITRFINWLDKPELSRNQGRKIKKKEKKLLAEKGHVAPLSLERKWLGW